MKNKTPAILYLITLIPSFSFSDIKTWSGSVPGNAWNHSEHWSPNGIPGIHDTAFLNTIPPIPRNEFAIAIIAPVSLGSLEFNNANPSTGYSIFGTHPLTFHTPAANATLLVGVSNASANTLDTDIMLEKDLDIFNRSSSQLVFSGSITGANKKITLYATGESTGFVEFTGNAHNSFSGITTIRGGNILFHKNERITAIAGDLHIESGSVIYLNDRQLPKTTTICLHGSTGNANLVMGPHKDTIRNLHLLPSPFINKVSIENGGKLTLIGDEIHSLSVSDNSILEGIGTLILNGVNTGITYNGSAQDARIETNIDLGNGNRNIVTNTKKDSLALRIAGNISNGSITKDGQGTLILTGDNTYEMGTTIRQGVLQGTTNSLRGSITNHGELAFDQDFDGVYSSVIQGNGAIHKKGTGTVSFTGQNNFQGGVLISEGTLEGTTLTIPGPIQNNGSLRLNQNFDGVFTENIQGSGSLIKQGNGTIFLTGVNTLSGPIVVAEGAIVGTTKSIQGDIVNYSSLILNQDFDDIYPSSINGSGTLIKKGLGTLILDKKNTHQGKIQLEAGSILVGHNEALGSSVLQMKEGTVLELMPAITTSNPIHIEDNLSYVKVPSGSSNLNGEIKGGTLVKTGNGILELMGVSDTTDFIVKKGALQLNGTLTTSRHLTIEPGAALFGTGALHGDLHLQGVLTAGTNITHQPSLEDSQIVEYFSFDKLADETAPFSEDLYLAANPSLPSNGGELYINGNVVISPDATVVIKFNPESLNLIHINGTLTLDSPTLQLLPSEGVYHLKQDYKIITAKSYEGTFGNVFNTFSMLQPSLTYNSEEGIFSVFFHLTKRHFSDLFQIGNSGQVARVLDFLADNPCQNSAIVIETLINTPTEKEIQHALNQMQPSLYTSLSVIQENDLFYLRNAIYTRLQNGQNQCRKNTKNRQEIVFDAPSTPIHVWGSLLGGYTNQANQSGEPGYIAQSPGAILCVDTQVRDNGILGGGVGYIYTHNEWNKDRGDADIHNIYATLYGDYVGHAGYITGALSGGYSFYSANRHISFGPRRLIQANAESNFQGVEGSIDLKMGLNYPVKSCFISPFLGLDYMLVHLYEFKETGARSLNLKLNPHNGDLLTTEGGLEFHFCHTKDSALLKAYLRASGIWERRFFGASEKASFLCGGSIQVDGLYPSRVLAGIGGGLNATFGRNQFSASYQAKSDLQFTDQSIYFEYLWRF